MTYSTPHKAFIAVRHSCGQLEDTNLVISEECVCVCPQRVLQGGAGGSGTGAWH